MADEKITTILQVELDAGRVASDLNELSRQIANVKNEQKQLDDEYKSGKITLDEYVKSSNAMKDELTWLQKEQKGLVATTKLLTSTTDTYADSLNGERQKLADMQKAYDQLDASFRESEGGKKFLEELQAQSEKVKKLEGDTGRFQRDVGNYPKALQGAIPAFDKINKALGSIGVSMQDLQTKGMKSFSGLGQSVKTFGKAFMTPPIIIITAVLSAILLVVDKVREAFKKNDNAMTALQKAFAVFKPIGEAVGKVFNAVAEGLAKVATAAADAVGWIAGKLSPAYKQAADDAQKLVERQDKLEESERNATVNAAARNAKIAKLREEAMQGEKYSVDERKKKLDEAIALEKKNLEEQKILARERLKMLEAEAKQNSDTSDEMMNKIAQARAAMYKAEETYYTGVRTLEKQQQSFDKEEKAKQQQKVQEARRRAKEKEQAEKEYEDFRIKTRRETEDALAGMEKDATKREVQAAKTAGERTIEDLRVKLSRLKKTDLEARKALEDLIIAVEKETQEKVTTIQIKAENERESLRRENGRKKAEMGVKDELELAQMRYDAAQEDYARLQQLTDEQIEALYGTQEQYQSALTDAEIAAYNAREELANEEWEKQQERKQREYEDKYADIDNEYAIAELQLEQKTQYYEDLLNMDEETKKAMFKNEEDYANAVKEAQRGIEDASKAAVQARIKSFAELGNSFKSLSNSLKGLENQSEETAKAQKAFAMMGIIVDQAQSISAGALAIAEGVQSAASIPFPANIPAMISVVATIGGMIASVMSSIMQAKQVFSQADAGNYATGGVVGGSSYSGDKLIAHVNSGEGIYTGTQANNLLQEIANNPARGGFDIEAYTEATAAAVAALPAPIMGYREFNEFQDNVASYDEIASVK